MIELALEEVADLCPGRLQRVDGAEVATGVQIDSRRISPGDLFVAVAGGDAYVAQALEAGAAAALVPDDAQGALARLASTIRARSSARVVAITGSTGKTSTKDILAAICSPRARTVAAEASYNNELGVPLTLCRLEPDTEVCILELAMRGLGQIASLATVARPEIGVVTNVGPAHIELVGSLDAVVVAKGELIEALPSGGTGVVPESFPVERDDVEIVRMGEVQRRLEGELTHVRFDGREVAFTFTARHQAQNALAALYAAHALGIDAQGTVEVQFSRWRGEELGLAGGGLLINDCWNANPVSMRAALEYLVDRAQGGRTVAVLGEMAELGPGAPSYHRDVGALATELGISALLAVGGLAHHYLDSPGVPESSWVATAAEAAAAAMSIVQPGDCVLVKGSRAVGLEAVAAALADAPV
jgi:UDP-N-acetylmuramoyl-tripeptide--D-alanyl-D-alanine ligase